MPRHRTHHSTMTCFFPQGVLQHLVHFKEESGQSWAEVTRLTSFDTVSFMRYCFTDTYILSCGEAPCNTKPIRSMIS